MNRRVILVDFNWMRERDPTIPLGHASILTALRGRGGLDVRSLVVAVNAPYPDAARITAAILHETEGIPFSEVDIAFGAYVWGEALLQRVLHLLRDSGFQGRLILGGPQVSYSGEGLERIYPTVDAFIRGYGEDALVTLASSSLQQPIKGVHWAGTPDAVEQAVVNLEALPSPWLSGTIPLNNQRFIRWETQRGCPFSCAFCQHRGSSAHPRRGALDRKRIEAEIDLFCESDVREIAVLDPIFNMGPHTLDILKRFAANGFTGRLSLQCRAEVVDDSFLDAASALDVCLEFGLQTIHKREQRAIRRRNRIDQVEAVLGGVQARGISHEVSLIYGLPLQTVDSFKASVAWCLEREVPVIKAFPLMLLRGTRLDYNREKWNLRNSDDAIPVVIQSSTFDIDGWRQMSQLAKALKLTERRHPKDLQELNKLAATMEPTPVARKVQ